MEQGMENLILRLATIQKGENSIPKNTIKILFEKLEDEKFQQIFIKWNKSFSEIHGNFDTQRKVDFDELESLYHLSINTADNNYGLFKLIFSLETYYSIILRCIGYKAVSNEKLDNSNIIYVLEGSYFEKINIFNYRCDEIYDWFFNLNEIDLLLKPIIDVFNSTSIDFYDIDLLKHINENIFPSKIRHSMGEFYTPDWLVNFVNDNIIDDDDEPYNKKFLDPTCGSASFLINIIQKYKSKNQNIINNIFGVDLNPISVLAAKTNILLAAKTEIQKLNKFYVLPIYHQDIIQNFLDNGQKGILEHVFSFIEVCINDKKLEMPRKKFEFKEILNVYISLKNMELITRLSNSELELYNLLKKYSLSEFEKDIFLSLYALHTLEKVDYIVGNPPWVNWEYLPKDYRNKNVQVWQEYGLFDLKGMDSTFIKEDISTLITYVVVDKYLKDKGKLGFVLKETLFKSSKQGNGFRKFFLKNTSIPLKVLKVYDLTQVTPFPGVINRTSILFLLKGEENTYPVPYYVWQSKTKFIIRSYSKINEILQKISILKYYAKPCEEKNKVSGWITLPENLLCVADKILGSSYYKARTGVFTGGANSVYWLKILNSVNNEAQIMNQTDRAINKVKDCVMNIEKDLVYPMIRGSELNFWNYSYSNYILCPHTKDTKINPIPLQELKTNYPKTYEYLFQFKEFLETRKGFAGWEKNILTNNFYAIQRIGPYTFERYKVAWRFISKTFKVAVIDLAYDKNIGVKIIIPNEKVISVGLSHKEEAYFLCGLLSSEMYRKMIEGYMVETQIGPHILEKLNIPKFDETNEDHLRISKLCENGHQHEDKSIFLNEINNIVSKMFDLN